MRIAYQGIPGCNSEAASELFATNQGFVDPEYIPAVHSAGVVEMLRSGKADYGVMASRNLIAGEVLETREALGTLAYQTVDAQWLSVHHCLFSKKEGCAVNKIASHVQALGQCRKHILKKYPHAELLEADDTAMAARWLAEGRYSDDTAVLCRKNAGEMFGLHLVEESMEDDSRNMTEFVLVKPVLKAEQDIIVAGLGLMGGSMARAIKKYTNYRVLGWNRTTAVAEKALAEGAIDGIASDEDFRTCDMLIPVLYPEATLKFLQDKVPQMKKGAVVVDLVGIKTKLTQTIGPLAASCGVRYTGGHPMAGKPRGGFERSDADLYRGASMILVPTEATAPGDIDELSRFFHGIGFGGIKVCSAEIHDHMIAHTSQLAHVVSNSYVKSPVSANYNGFSGGSYKDMTRVASINEKVWSELFLDNKEALLPEIDDLIRNITAVREAIAAGDVAKLEELLRQGRLAKERIDAANPNQPSD